MIENIFELINVAINKNLNPHAIIIFFGLSIVFLILCAILAKFIFLMYTRVKDESTSHAVKFSEFGAQLQADDVRINKLEQDVAEIREHVDYIVSKQSGANTEITDRMSAIKEKIAGMSALLEFFKEKNIHDHAN